MQKNVVGRRQRRCSRVTSVIKMIPSKATGWDPSKGSLDDHVDRFRAAVLNRAAAKTNLTDTKQHKFHLGTINARQIHPEKV